MRGYKLLRVPLVAGLPVSRGFLVKRHEARDPADREEAAKTLFITHLDAFVTEAQLSRCFGAGFGPVERVVLKSVEKRAPKAELRADGVKVHVVFARVIFREASSVERALEAATGRIAGALVLPPPPAEFKERLKAGKEGFYRDAGELRREVDAFMAAYDERENEKRRIARETAVDDDGFTKVVSGITRTADGLSIRAAKRPDLKTGAFAEPLKSVQASTGPGGESIGNPGEGPRKKKKIREMPDFYRFQMREQKRQEIVDHRKRKAEDTEKVEYMKKKKKFKTKV